MPLLRVIILFFRLSSRNSSRSNRKSTGATAGNFGTPTNSGGSGGGSGGGGGAFSNLRLEDIAPVPSQRVTYLQMASSHEGMNTVGRVGTLQQQAYRERTSSCSDASVSSDTSSHAHHHHHHHHHHHNHPHNANVMLSGGSRTSVHNSNCSINSSGSNSNHGLETIQPPAIQFSVGSRRRAYSCSSTPASFNLLGGRQHNTATGAASSGATNSPLRSGSDRRSPTNTQNVNPSSNNTQTTALPTIPSSPTKDNQMGDICGNIPCRTRTMPEMGCFGTTNTTPAAPVTNPPGSLQRSRTDHTLDSKHSPSRQPVSSLIPYSTQPGGGVVFTVASDDLLQPPFLQQETLMPREHNEILARLNFLLALVDCILELARATGSAINVRSTSPGPRDASNGQL